ncbi:MAG TPA: amidohydrolase family protein [Dehalococcoidia bacterium]|nr:amidohydrolase family protein [Dehalococcoidia bacterium]
MPATKNAAERAIRIISADSHTLEPVDMWQRYLSPKFRDRIAIIHEWNGQKGDFVNAPPIRPATVATFGCAGIPAEKIEEWGRGGYAAVRRGGWDPAERIRDMDADGVDAEVLFAGITMFMYQHPDAELQRDAFRAYNDWVAEYQSHDPRRLLGIASVAIRDVHEALKELERAAKLGLRGVLISSDPPPELRYTNPAWEPFWAEAEKLGLPVCMHILTGSQDSGLTQDVITSYMNLPRIITTTIMEMIVGGVLERHPRLKLVSAENDIGWLANAFRRLDQAYYRWGNRYPAMQMSATDYWRRQVYCTFQDDVAGVRTRDLVGSDNLLWASDYPHFDSTWPRSQEFIQKNFGDIPLDEKEKFLRGNMITLYNLDLN